jgi:hypothetical protein
LRKKKKAKSYEREIVERAGKNQKSTYTKKREIRQMDLLWQSSESRAARRAAAETKKAKSYEREREIVERGRIKNAHLQKREK